MPEVGIVNNQKFEKEKDISHKKIENVGMNAGCILYLT